MTVEHTPFVRPTRRLAVRALAVATTAALTLAACSDDEPDTAEPTPTSTASTSTAPEASGSSTVPGHIGRVPITFALPDGWDDTGWGVIKGDPAYGLLFMEAGNAFVEPCQSLAFDPPVGPSVDDLASAWAGVPDLDATAPTDITVDGFDGKLVEFDVPDFVEADCTNGHYILLEGIDTPGDGYWAQGPQQHHQLRILDIDGTRVVIGATWYPDTSAQDRAAIDEMLSSITIG